MSSDKQSVFMLSGLGADKRAFRDLQFSVEHEIIHLDWLKPVPCESLPDYAYRLINFYGVKKEATLIGLSFGGLVAVEIAKALGVKKTILISSASNKFELPWIYRVCGKLHITKLAPKIILNKHSQLINWLFGVTSKQNKSLLSDIIKSTDTDFAKWAINALATWNGEVSSHMIFRVHGTNDKLIPMRGRVDQIVVGGGHLMVLENSAEVNRVLNNQLA